MRLPLPAFEDLVPKSIVCLRNYDRQTFLHDLTAGVTVGLVALPLAMAFAIASGVPPQAGLYCAVIAGFIISALGGSNTQIGGPTGAFVVVVAGIIAKHGVDGLMTVTLMAGVLLVILGITGMGAVIQYIPRPVVIGFTNGIAVLIASTQIKDFFGLHIDKVPGEFVQRMAVIAEHWETLDPVTTAVAGISLAVIILLRRVSPRIPGSVVALLGATVVAAAFGLKLDTIKTHFGGIPSGLPHFSVPNFHWNLVLPLLSPAMTVAMLGAIESLLSAVVSDRMSGDQHNPNVELVAQGIANILSPVAGGLPATGAIARTATNIRAGGRTPVAGMIHAAVLAIILLAAAPLAGHIPLGVLAAILMTVAYNMGEWHEIPEILRLGWSSGTVWAVTFALTVLADLTVAVQAGMILAVLIFIRKVTMTTTITRVTDEDIASGRKHSLQLHQVPEHVAIFRVHGPFLFGSTQKLALIEREIPTLPNVIILRLRNMTAIDSTGLKALQSVADQIRNSGRHVILCGMRPQPRQMMRRGDFRAHLGEGNICHSVREALARARELQEVN
ncbi:MAG TPA: SulP family inorganic anion transporter [Candidatus Sulfopaludibacter sp.]|jgi:SulP family sulfate permease|nr:SulP family inorganic anion transporter [Candidatus Sulfopaludibacter sp.]